MPAAPVPVYQQTSDFSCGAASLVMALHSLRGMPVTRGFEFELWREGTMIGTRGMDQWGITLPALRRGVPATVISRGALTFPFTSPLALARFSESDLDVARFAQAEHRRQAEAGGVVWDQREPEPADLAAALGRGTIPVVLVELALLGGDTAPHWVVASRVEGDRVRIHDPDPDGKGAAEWDLLEFWKATDVSQYQAARAIVAFGP